MLFLNLFYNIVIEESNLILDISKLKWLRILVDLEV